MGSGRDNAAMYPLRSVDRVCDILDALADSPEGVSLTHITDSTGLPKSSAFRYLSALESRNYVERNTGDGLYKLGLAFRPQHTGGIARLTDLARPALERLRDKLDETTNLGFLDGTSVIHRVVCESKQMMRLAAYVGDRGYVHATALGKAIASELPEQHVRSIMELAGMPALTDATITSLPALFAELQQIRESGYAVDEEENQDGGRCVAVAIPGLRFAAAISVSAPAYRFKGGQVSMAARALNRVAKELSRQMQT